MKILDHIHRKRREKTLLRLAATPHEKRLPNLDQVRSIGIVLPDSVPQEEQRILQYFNDHMVKRHIVVSLYRLPAPNDKDNHTRIGFPSPAHLSTFSSHTYDLLFATTPPDDHRTLFAILSTPARLRIAYDDTSLLPSPLATQAYDLFIRGNGPCNLAGYLRETLLILTNIK